MTTGWGEPILVNNVVLRNLQEQHLAGKLRPNDLDKRGVSLLHKAALDGQLTCLKWLIKYGGDPKIRSLEGSVPAHYAAGGGHLNILQYLYEISKDSLSSKDKNQAAPLYIADPCSKRQTTECRQFYLMKLENANFELALASYFKNLVEFIFKQNYIAAQEGQLDCLIWLTKSSAISPNDKTVDGMTPSHACAQEGKLNCLRYLLKNAHAHDNVTDNNGLTLLHYACSQGNNKICKWLIEHCSLTGDEQDNMGATALHIAAKCGHSSTIETLVKSNICLDIRDNKGSTALDYAIMNQETSCANILKDLMLKASLESKTPKKVRFNELVYTSDATLFTNTLNNYSNYKNKKRNLWDEEDMQAQFDSWLSTPQHFKHKNENKTNLKSLFKGKTKQLNKQGSPKSKIETNVIETKVKLDSPDILKNLNDESVIKSNDIDNVLIGNDNNNSNDVNIRQTQKAHDKLKRKNIMKHTPPDVPKRNGGLNLTVVRQNSLVSLRERSNKIIDNNNNNTEPKSVTYPDHFFAHEPSKQTSHHSYLRPSSSLNNLSNLNFSSDAKYIQRKDIMKYLPKSYLRNKIRHSETQGYSHSEKNGFIVQRPTTTTAGASDRINGFSKQTFGNDRQDYGNHTAQREKVQFFSRNMYNKSNKVSAWSTIRQGVATFFSSLRQRKTNQDDWNSVSNKSEISPREDIFSRFSLTRKSEFDDLFNSSTEGLYNTRGDELNQPNKNITSLQKGYNADDLSRLRDRALDESLKGTNNYLRANNSSIRSSSSLKTEKEINQRHRKNSKTERAFMW